MRRALRRGRAAATAAALWPPALALLAALPPGLWPRAARAEDGAVAASGDVARGRAIVDDRSLGLCGLCHALPGQPAALQGTLGPPLAGVGARLTAAQLADRLWHPERFNAATLMPAYGRSEGLTRVLPARQGQPLLTRAQIDDVVAYLASLR